MDAQSPQIVGIVGGSCAGKTWLATRLQERLGEAVRLSLDDFYLDRSYLSPRRRAQINFDHPRAIDWERLEQVLRSFARGAEASVPRYDFATHGRMPGEAVLEPAALVIAEGLWLFRRPSVRELFNMKIFIRSPEQLSSARRLERDVLERGRTREQVLEQLQRHTLPMQRRFVEPQERWADVVLEAPIDETKINRLVNRIERKLSSSVGI